MLSSLKDSGLKNPHRIKKLIHQAIEFFELNLGGVTVLTEAASNNYVVTPVIAAMAGAQKVYAITADSQYGTAKDVAQFTYEFATFCGVKDTIEIVFEKGREMVSRADIVTNLGFVRPINKDFIEMMKDSAVIPLMFEDWELRQSDIDLPACGSKGIQVMATNEDYPGLEVFDFSGNLCVKMLFELEIEVYKSKIAIISQDKFGAVIERYLIAAGATAARFANLEDDKCRGFLKGSDALVIADMMSSKIFIGKNGQITADELYNLAPGISVIQFCGIVEVDELSTVGIPYFPLHRVGEKHMGMTLAALGPRPVIDLHTAGLKVGELMVRTRKRDPKRTSSTLPIDIWGRWAILAHSLSSEN